MAKEKKATSDKEPIIFKRKRGGKSLTKKEIKHIKSERKKLRKEMKRQGLKKRQDFEVTAASLGLYFDKRRGGLLWWWLKGKALWALLGALFALLFVLFLASLVPQMRGHFTINLSSELMKVGFTLSETEDFANPMPQLFSDPVEDALCISFASIPEDVDTKEGNHSADYFAYSFFLRNESEIPVGYLYNLSINSESKDISRAVWIMLFHNGQMRVFAEANAEGEIEALPSMEFNDRGYPNPWMIDYAEDKSQFELLGSKGSIDYYRVLPIKFASEDTIVTGERTLMETNQIDKFTVVVWLEGDDPECTDELIDGHMGLEMNFRLINEESHNEESDVWSQVADILEDFFANLRFWKD